MKQLLFIAALLFQGSSFATYYSQCDQDKVINEEFFHNFRNGVFVEIGASDGLTISNTLFFEQECGWKGICVEPIPFRFELLKRNRKCICIQGCVTDRSGKDQLLLVSSPGNAGNIDMLSGLLTKYDPRHLERVDYYIDMYNGSYELIDVQCYLLNDLLDQNGIKHVNYLSIDTEGGEFDIISTINFNRFKIDVITLEDNDNDKRFVPFLASKGFHLHRRLGHDLLFINDKF